MPVPDQDGGVSFNVADLKEMIHQVAFAASADDARPVLTGVLVTVEGKSVIMAAADGFRLSVREAELSKKAPKSIHAIIPGRALHELARIVGDGEESVNMILPPGRGQVVFSMKDIELTSQLIEGAFPEYQQIIPTGYNTRAVISTEAFLKACKQAEIFARDGSHIARLNISLGGDICSIGRDRLQ
jgi:DNA polymerase-3 subunit beta